jgi:rhamnulokinase
MSEKCLLAVDMGASSGRVVAGHFDGERLRLEEVHRFENGPVEVVGTLHWDLLAQWTKITDGLRAAREQCGDRIVSVGVDTWGVDFVLLGRDDTLLGNPVHYRDSRTDGILDFAFETVSRADIFAATGLQFLPFNTLFQLLAMRRQGSPLLDLAESMLMMSDAFHWLLSGEKSNEYTNATTTQFFDPSSRCWATGLLEQFNLPTAICGPIVQPGTPLGPLRSAVAESTGLKDVSVVAPGSHDTASAVLAVPADTNREGDWCYISSGTWSLLGAEVPQPVVSDRCRQLNFTNEGGVAGTVRLLKNIGGLWLLQECRRQWADEGRDYDWDDMLHLAAAAPRLASLADPDNPAFLSPGNMPAAIRKYCSQTGQPVPESDGAVVRTALEGLALKYRLVLGWLEELTGTPVSTIHIVGGGAHNRPLCQATADACGRRVLAGPTEATAIGNIMAQAMAHGDVANVQQAREVIRRSFLPVEYLPGDTSGWDDAFARFSDLCQAGG